MIFLLNHFNFYINLFKIRHFWQNYRASLFIHFYPHPMADLITCIKPKDSFQPYLFLGRCLLLERVTYLVLLQICGQKMQSPNIPWSFLLFLSFSTLSPSLLQLLILHSPKFLKCLKFPPIFQSGDVIFYKENTQKAMGQ